MKQQPQTFEDLTTVYPRDQYSEDYGTVLWWSFPVHEPPIVDGFDVSNLPENYMHWSRIPPVWDSRGMPVNEGDANAS